MIITIMIIPPANCICDHSILLFFKFLSLLYLNLNKQKKASPKTS